MIDGTPQHTDGAPSERPPPESPAYAALRPRRNPVWIALEYVVVGLIYLCGVSAILFVFGIFFFIFREGAPLIVDKLDIKEFFLSTEWNPTSAKKVHYGILALIIGTASVTVMAMLVAVPFGLGTAVFIAEFCGNKLKEVLKIMVELLAAVPSVVWGFIGLKVMSPLITELTGAPVGQNALNAGIVVGLMSVPIIVSIAEDAIRAVPDAYRAAAEALGATRWQIIYRVILPAGKSGLLAAVLLGVGRAVGETMAVLMATGHAPNVPFDGNFPFFHALRSVQTLTATIASELGEAPHGSDHYRVLFVLGIVLFTITFFINLIADLVVRGVRKR